MRSTGEVGRRGVAGPAEIEDAHAFAEALTDLRVRAGLSIRAVSRATGIPSATLGGWFSGRHLPPASQKGQLAAVLTTVGVPDAAVPEWWEALSRIRRFPGPRAAGRAAPYRGLESYDVEDAPWFVGREGLVDALCETVGSLLDGTDGTDGTDGVRRSVSVVGASGSGKSSLVRAGLVARMRTAGVSAAVMAPGAHPCAGLEAALGALGEPGGRRLLVVDQLEELFADRVPPEERAAFLTALGRLADVPATVVVVALRADFYGLAVAEAAALPLLRSHQLIVGPLDGDSLRRVVVEPAARAGFSVEPELVELALRDLHQRGGAPDARALPLLSHALLATWARAQRGSLTVSDYVAVGGVAGAVQRTAEEVYGALDPGGRSTARRLFGQLVSVDDDGITTRRRMHHADLPEDEELAAVVEAFVAGRILTATADTLEISHEVLLEAWPRLARWVEADREQLRLRRRVSRAAADWDRHGREREGLMRGTLLDQVCSAPPGLVTGLTAVERSFLAASREDAERRHRTARRRSRLMRTLFAGVAVLALVTTLLSAYLVEAIEAAGRHQDAAEEARNRALSRQVAVQASQLRDLEPSLTAQLALAAHDLAPTVAARSALLEATGSPRVGRLPGPEGSMRAVAAPDGSVVATATSDGRVRLWDADDLADPEPLATVEAHEAGELYAAAFSDSGRLLAVGGQRGVVTVIDVRDPAAPRRWPPLRGAASVQDLVFDGAVLLVAGGEPTVHRWRVDGGSARRLSPVPVDAPVQSVAQGPEGLVATGSTDGSVRLWRSREGRLVLDREIDAAGSRTVVRSVAFSPGGWLVAAGLSDATVRVWRVGSGREETEPLTGAPSWVNGVAFSGSGRRLAAASSGGLVQVFDTRSWEERSAVRGAANLTSVQFLDEDRRLLTGAIDGQARLVSLDGPRLPALDGTVWGLAAPEAGGRLYVGVGREAPMVVPVDVTDPLAPRFDGEPLVVPEGGPVLDGVVAVSPDGSLLVAGTATGEVVVWRLAEDGAATYTGVVPAASKLVENLSFSADGSHVVASSDDGTAVLLDAPPVGLPRVVARMETPTMALGVAVGPDASLVAVGGADNLVRLFEVDPYDEDEPRLLATLDGPENYVYGVAFSPDGRTLAAGSADDTVRLWDVRAPERPRPLGGPLRGPADTVFAVTFDRSGERLAAASQDGRVWVWRLERSSGGVRAEQEARLGTLGEEGLYQVLFHPDGSVTAGGAGGSVRTWLTDPGAARELVCASAGGGVTPDEWEQFVPGAPYAPPCSG